ncbi:adenosine deaminase [Paracoccaceae bacterium]|nr:adenosine deaminase [Paracoccaceae bacterium]
MNIRKLPKIELHLHLEGAAPPNFIRQLAFEKNIDLTQIFNANGDYCFSNFNEFLATYESACQVLKEPEDFHRLTRSILEKSAENGVIYTEVFISPDFCGGGDLTAWKEYLAAIEEAANSAKEDLGIEMRGIVTCIRHNGPSIAKKASICAAETASNFVIGFGMGGDELVGTQGDFTYSFNMADEAGLGLTTHAGEWGGAESVRQALQDLRVTRLGHGIQIIDDTNLIREAIDKKITLEVCPGSNVSLGIFEKLSMHPINSLLKSGLLVTVSTDDPPFFNTTMTSEYNNLRDVFDWDEDIFKLINQNAIHAAFCGEEQKLILLERINSAWTKT